VTKTNGGASEDQPAPIGDNRLDRVLAGMIVGIVVLSVVAILTYMIGTAGGWLAGPTAYVIWTIFFVGLPIAIVLMIVVTIRIGIRRRRDSER